MGEGIPEEYKKFHFSLKTREMCVIDVAPGPAFISIISKHSKSFSVPILIIKKSTKLLNIVFNNIKTNSIICY